MKKTRKKYSVNPLIILAFIALLLLLWGVGFKVWLEYRNTLIQNQKDQLLITAETLGENMGLTLTEYEDNLDFLSALAAEGDRGGEIYEQFLDTQSRYECNIFFENADGEIREKIREQELENPVMISQIDEAGSIWQYEDGSGKKYLVFKKKLENGDSLCIVVDEEQYYQHLISGIHIGSNGYVMIKNSRGLILMHPDRQQWGIKVIEGRRELYPDLDYANLEEMVEVQSSGESGLYEYYSYWWTDPELPRVKKVSAYAPAQIGSDFWVISAVVDYDDLYEPVRDGFRNLLLIFAGSLLIFLALFFHIGKLLRAQKAASEEIVYLRELNSLLEEVQRGEENIAHQQRLQIMGTMTGGIAHEFNNFLTPIMGHAELLMMELDEKSDEFDSAKEIYEASEKAKEVIRQISSLSRKNVETVYRMVPARKMLQRVMKMAASVCPANIHLEQELELGDEAILGNATQINQVILNICVNAVHAIGKKEGKITLRASTIERSQAEKLPVLEKVRRQDIWNRYLAIAIEDDGCGMDADTLKQIFDPFFTTKKGGEGTGLGLSLAEQIIRSHKGYIYAESEPGKGTVFHILLPVPEPGTGEEMLRESREEELQILIADDNAKILQLLERNFAKLELPVITCRTREELYAVLRERRIDVLVIDESIEGGNGVEFCMALQAKYPDMMKIVMADHVTREIAEAKQKKIIDGYVEKPVSDTVILEAVRSCREI